VRFIFEIDSPNVLTVAIYDLNTNFLQQFVFKSYMATS